MNNYVLGFLFDPTGKNVALIKKVNPPWQAGRLNGIGGKIEYGESPIEAMHREFKEETGVTVEWWKYCGTMRDYGFNWEVSIFCTADKNIDNLKTTTEEQVVIVSVEEALCLSEKETVNNVPWLIGMCKDIFFNKEGPTKISIVY